MHDSPHSPANHVENRVVYTGTHDHDTARGWYESLDAAGRRVVDSELDNRGIAEREPWWGLIRLAMGSPARVAMVIVPGVRVGPDHKMHDSFTPADFTAPAGEKIIVTVINYDTGWHSFTAPSLHLNVLIPRARRSGVPAVQVFSFTVHRAGVYRWHCMQPCDDESGGWAMAHQGYMAGTITIEPA